MRMTFARTNLVHVCRKLKCPVLIRFLCPSRLAFFFNKLRRHEQKSKCHAARNGPEHHQVASSKKQEKALIAVEGADQLFREIRIANTLTNDNDDDVSLKAGAQVLVTVATK